MDATEFAFPEFVERPPWCGGDLQTVRNYVMPLRDPLAGRPTERLELPLRDGSGDRLAAALNRPAPGQRHGHGQGKGERNRPLVILLHGLTGSEASPYMRHSAARLLAEGYPVLRLNLRGAGPSRPLCRLHYHAGLTADLGDAVAALPPPLAAGGLVAVGFSLGANMLLKLLGETGAAAPFRAAVAVSAPLDLALTAERMRAWRNWPYERYLLAHMKAESLLPAADPTARERAVIRAARSVIELDDRFVAPRNGFAGAADYYARSAARGFLAGITVPTLVIHALDDPWIPPAAYRGIDWRRHPALVPLITRHGGHVGFQGREPGGPWHDHRIVRFLDTLLSRP